ncbi:MAG: hypothetical protein NC910_04255 [Candidatus Omnitrophica bacterium]|nr:hypothetical protein [Candidatus Omnitrophota bacterium]
MNRVLPWLMLGMGMALGVLLMSSRMGVPPTDAQATAPQNTSVESTQQLLPPSDFSPKEPARGVPKAQPKRNRSGLV